MQRESTSQPEQTCQWCGGTIPARSSACADCGASRPREDLVAPGLTLQNRPSGPTGASAPTMGAASQPDLEEVEDDEVRARQIMKDLNAYIPEEIPPPRTGVSEPGDDAMIIIGALLVSGVIGGLFGWFLAPSLLHDFFQDVVGVDSDGPEAFRRLGAFIGALVAMLFGALAATIMRR